MDSKNTDDNFFGQTILNSLESSVCLLDKEGNIELVNNSWLDIAKENNVAIEKVSEGCNYLEVCDNAKGDGKEIAKQFAFGIRSVIAGEKDKFELEYPCYYYSGERWSLGKVIPYTKSEKEPKRKVVVYHEDITDRKLSEKLIQSRLNMMELSYSNTLEEVLQKTIDESCKITDSKIGFYHFVSEDEKMLTLKAWSSDTIEHCPLGDQSGMEYAVYKAGVWVDCIRERRTVVHNDYPSLTHRQGLPEGHSQVTRELVVPIMRQDKIVAILGVGNKSLNYTDQDVEIVKYFADIAWELAERKQAEQQIYDYTMELELKSLELEETYSQLDKEVDKARIMHERSLPKEIPRMEEVSMCAYYQPAQRMGGDFYDTIRVDNKLIFYVSDVTGHGLEGTLFSTFVKTTINNYINLKPEDIEPGKIICHLNNQYRKENYPDDYFVCIFLMVLDLETMELVYTGAGFQDLPFVQMGNGEKTRLAVEGPPISTVIPEELMDYTEGKLKLTPGTSILINTDGLTEQLIGEEQYNSRLEKVFYEHRHLPPELILNAIKEDFRRFNGGSLQSDDDITIGIIQIKTD